MQSFEIKTHRPGATYTQPHFFILNKGLNSGRPLNTPCPNCFVVTTASTQERNHLFYLAMMLQMAKCFEYYLRGSVIPFIVIADCKKLLLSHGTQTGPQLDKTIQAVQAITQKEEALKQTLQKIKALKQAYILSCLNSRKT